MATDESTPTTSTTDEGSATEEQSLAERGSNRSQRPDSMAFRDFMSQHWAPRDTSLPEENASAPWAKARRERLSEAFAGERLVIPAGDLKVRSNDTDYAFRPHSAFSHMTGTGAKVEPGAVLVLHPLEEGGHEAILYFHPCASRDTDEFFADSRYGEFWVGARPTLEYMQAATGIRTAHIDELGDALAKDAGQVTLRVVREASETVNAQVAEIRSQVGQADSAELDNAFAEALSEARLIKDEWELEQMCLAVDATADGFADMIRSLPRAREHHRGERVLEGAFGARAREEGNDVGYETIAAAGNHANTLHWTDNDGTVRDGDLVLIDAGIEVDSLYTADITRTLPINGRFSPAQRRVYDAVLKACEASLAAAHGRGVKFRDIHAAAMEVIAHELEDMGILPISAGESLQPDSQLHRRWMVHGTSHHLGLDVHDCAQARREMYLDAELQPGMCFTIEPGLYFHEDDLIVPEEYRGIGVRIEDDVYITEDYRAVRMSEDIPRTADEVEAWMAGILDADA
ncbi:MAG: aminopeptidase P family protein [Bowdeniella nasicola]|nr:aminopeptidase P family protein [Bowdeniella nasicola]